MKSKIKELVPLSAKRFLYRQYTETAPIVLSRILNIVGYNVSRSTNFYSPLPSVSELKATRNRWDKPSQLNGLKYDVESMKTLLSSLLRSHVDEYLGLPDYQELHSKGFGLGYTPTDSLTLFLMIRHLKPKRYIEVWSGLSTYYCHLAAELNRSEGFPLEMICIEPYPLKNLLTLPDIEVIQSPVQDIEPSLFRKLQSGDMLFIDSSHVVRIDGDVPYLFLEILPTLSKGVNIHIHDIPFPYNSPFPSERWVFGVAEPMFWTEAMLLQAFLAHNDDFEILLSLPIIRHFDEGFLRSVVPKYKGIDEDSNAFSSIFLRRVS